MEYLVSSIIHLQQLRKLSTEMLINLPENIEQVSGRAKIQTQAVKSQTTMYICTYQLLPITY
jgi:hypothetical protein